MTTRQDWLLTTRTNTSGNQQLFGGPVFLEINRSRIGSWVVRNAGTSKTVSLGLVSAATTYVNGATAAAGLTEITLATRFPATQNLWCNSNGTDVLTHTLHGHRIG